MSIKGDILRSMGINNFCVDEFTEEVQFTNPALTDEQKTTLESRYASEKHTVRLRGIRNSKLQQSDWTQGADVPDSIKTPWAEYRAKLRNLPATTSDHSNVTWPTPPST